MIVHPLRYRWKVVARRVLHKRTGTGGAFDFREGRLIELYIIEANGGEAVDLQQVNEVAATALVDAEVNTFCNTRCDLAELLCFAA
eukprot:6213886-Pleurochrysis_carterae.AAC.1